MGAIGKIREHSGIAVAIVGIAIVAFIIGDLTKNKGGIPDMGKIGKTTITAQHFNALTDEMEAQVKAQQGIAQISNDMEYRIREQVWQNLVQETLLEKEYEALGIQVTADEISDMYSGDFIHPYLRQMFTNPQTGEYNTQAIKYYTENFDQLDSVQKMQWVDLEKNVKKDRALQKYSTLITKAFYTPKAIAEKLAEIDATTSTTLVAALPFSSVSDEEANPTEEDYKAYYAKHKAEFRVVDELRAVDYVLFPVNPTQQDLANIQNDVMKVWEEFSTDYADAEMTDLAFFVNSESDRSFDSTYLRSNAFAAPFDSVIARSAAGSMIAPQIVGNEWMMAKVLSTDVRPDSLRASVIYVYNEKAGSGITRTDDQASSLADSIVGLLKTNKVTFENAVQQFSDNKDNNGDMGWVLDGGYGFLNEDILRTPVDGVFKYEFPQHVGYMIVKVTGKSAPEKKYRVALITREIQPSESTEKAIYNQANQFAGQNRTYSEMVASAQEQNLPVRNEMTSMMMTNLGSIQNARSIVQWVFDAETEVGTVADQVFSVDNAYVVAALKDVYKKGYATLDQVRSMIETQVRVEKKGEIALAKAQEAAKSAKTVEAIAGKLGSTIDTVAGVEFGSYYFGQYGMEPKVLAAVAVNAAKGNKAMLAPIKGASAVYMVQILNTEKKPAEAVSADTYRERLQMQASQKVNGIINVLREKTNVVDQRNKFF